MKVRKEKEKCTQKKITDMLKKLPESERNLEIKLELDRKRKDLKMVKENIWKNWRRTKG